MTISLDLGLILALISILTAMIGVVAWAVRTVVKANAKVIDTLTRLERLEKSSQHRKRDAEMTLMGLRACLEGLKEQGCNGEVRKTLAALNQYILESR